jgi:hypothetical protein
MRFRATAARAKRRAKTEHDEEKLRVAKELLEILRDVGVEAELWDGATSITGKRLN